MLTALRDLPFSIRIPFFFFVQRGAANISSHVVLQWHKRDRISALSGERKCVVEDVEGGEGLHPLYCNSHLHNKAVLLVTK